MDMSVWLYLRLRKNAARGAKGTLVRGKATGSNLAPRCVGLSGGTAGEGIQWAGNGGERRANYREGIDQRVDVGGGIWVGSCTKQVPLNTVWRIEYRVGICRLAGTLG